MNRLLLTFVFLIPLFGYSQNDSVYYYSVNGKIENPGKPDVMKKVDFRSARKIRIKTYKATESDWMLIYTENIKVLNDSVLEIKIKGEEFSGQVSRKFEKQENGIYKFTDWLENHIKRQGQTKSKIPLILDGEITEFYPFGRIKSVSQYKNNELFFNQNWLPNGDVLIDDIFYSVDEEPQFVPGLGALHKHVTQVIRDYEFDLATVQGKVLVGVVVTKDGTIDGVQIVKGISQQLNGILVNAFNTLEGKWVPAKLNNKNVNYFQLVPINFIYNRYNFEYLELKGSNLHWVIN
ncbi:MAG: hypothetical protein FD181_3382 [Prolixibacteraceae bacterium]|nr:MAG: hypothetical protein FD181_3382 [Prolixibacteraceae bacterium]